MREVFLLSIRVICFLYPASVLANDWWCPQGQVVFKPYSCVRYFYVDGTGGSDANSGSQTSPWATIQHANDSGVLTGGDCVNVAAGNYVQAGKGYSALDLTSGGNANSPTGYVTYISAGGHAAKILGNPSLINLVNIEAPYIILDGFEFDATSVISDAVSDASHQGHHLMLLNNLIHDAGGAGIGFSKTDYLTVYGNGIYNNAFPNPVKASGISIYEPEQVTGFVATPADSTPFHIVIQNNVVWGNSTQNSCAAAPGCVQSDGHGIIADNWLHTNDAPYVAYPYQGLIQSNLTFNNGGAGIAFFLSQNVTAANNTAYNNNLDTNILLKSRGEIFVVGSNNVTLTNNIMYAFPVASDPILGSNQALFETNALAPGGNYTGIIWESNITFNGTLGQASATFATPTSVSDLATFVATNNAGVWPMLNPYQPVSGSPAIGTGTSTPSYPPKSLCGAPMNTPPNIGAY